MAEESKPDTERETEIEAEGEPAGTAGQEQYICSQCGAKVVPQRVETPSGVSNRCPECGKFMKPLTPEEVAKRREAEREGRGYEDPYDQMVNEMAKKLHRELLKTPNVSAEKASSIVDDFRQDRVLQESPTELYYLIMDYSPKAKSGLLGRVLDRVFSIPDEYADTLAERPPIRERVSGRGRESVDWPSRRRRGTRRESIRFPGRRSLEDGDDYGYLAYGRDRREQREHELRMQRMEEEHELRMKKLGAEILNITAETGDSEGSKGEPLVKVKVGEESIEVPASIAPLYLKRDDSEVKSLEDKLEREREERLKERDERHKAEMKRLEEKIDGQPSFLEQLEYYERTGQRLGLRQTGRTTMDVLDSFRGDVQETAQQLLNRLPTPGGEFKPEITRSPEERRKAAETIKTRLEKSEEILKAEDELLKAVAEK